MQEKGYFCFKGGEIDMISINNLTVAYGGFTLLNEINFHISESDKIGLVGKTGVILHSVRLNAKAMHRGTFSAV